MLPETKRLVARLTRHATAFRAADLYQEASDIEAALAIITAGPFARRVYRALHPLENGNMEHVPENPENGEENEHGDENEEGTEGDEPEAVNFEAFKAQMLTDLAEFETNDLGDLPEKQYMGDWFESFAAIRGWE